MRDLLRLIAAYPFLLVAALLRLLSMVVLYPAVLIGGKKTLGLVRRIVKDQVLDSGLNLSDSRPLDSGKSGQGADETR